MKKPILLLAWFLYAGGLFAQNNSIDTTFGIKGSVFTSLDTSQLYSSASLVQMDGKIVLAGSSEIRGYVVRYNMDGSLDSAFGNNGVYSTNDFSILTTIIQTANGKLMIGGARNQPNGFLILNTEGIVARLNSKGSLDTAFGDSGIIAFPYLLDPWVGPIEHHRITQLEELSSGKIMVYGTGREFDANSSYSIDRPMTIVSRLHTNGDLDTTYNKTGYILKVLFGWFGLNVTGVARVVEKNGFRYLLGSADYTYSSASLGNNYFGHQSVTLDKIDTAGAFDSVFNYNIYEHGYVFADIPIRPTDMVLQGNKLLVSGFLSSGGSYGNPYPKLGKPFGIFRLHLDGRVDSTFGINGIQYLQVDSSAIATSMVVLPANDIVLTGLSKGSGSSHHVTTMVKLDENGTLDSCMGIRKGIKATATAGPYVERTPNIVKVDGNRFLIASVRDSSSGFGFQLTRYILRTDSIYITQKGNTLSTNVFGGNYQWLDCTTMQPISGETGQNFIPSTNGSYAIVVDQNGCVDTSACFSVINIGIEEEKMTQIRIFPNPNSGSFSIDFNGNPFTGQLEIYSLTGQLVLKKGYQKETKIELDLGMAKGMYQIHLTSKSKKYSGRIILQ